MGKELIDKAVNCFKSGFSCSQAVLSTFGEALGLEYDLALKISGAFGGGMAGMAETCGAVTGAFMVIGLKYGKTKPEDEETKRKAYALVKEFVREFKARNSSIICRDLVGCDISTSEGKQQFKDRDCLNSVCSKLVGDAVEILSDIF